MDGIRSREPLFVCDGSMTIVEWNDAARELTGIEATDAIGEKCWRVLRGRNERGETICHAACSAGRLARRRWATGCGHLSVATAGGRRPLAISTILVESGEEFFVLHPMHNGIETAESELPREPPPLTARQRQVLAMLAAGMRARVIAAELHLAEATVRNHIRAIRRELGTHSQLEAVAEGRRLGLVR